MDELTRRRFLSFLLTSPLLAQFGGILESLGEDSVQIIHAPNQALDVLDFEAAARAGLPPAHYGFLASGVDESGGAPLTVVVNWQAGLKRLCLEFKL